MNREKIMRTAVIAVLVVVIALTITMIGAGVIGMLRAHLGL